MTTSSNDSVAFLLAQLEAIRTTSSPIISHIAVGTFFEGLEHVNENDRRRLVGAGTFETIIAASKQQGHNPHFYHRTLGILSMFLMQEPDGEEYALQIMEKGGVESTIRIMQSWASDEFLQISGINLLLLITSQLPLERCIEISATVLENVVTAMERHRDSVKLYEVACNAIGHSFAPSVQDSKDLSPRAVSCVWYGVAQHIHDEAAQDVGRQVLFHIAPSWTKNVVKIDHSECHHCVDVDCSYTACV